MSLFYPDSSFIQSQIDGISSRIALINRRCEEIDVALADSSSDDVRGTLVREKDVLREENKALTDRMIKLTEMKCEFEIKLMELKCEFEI